MGEISALENALRESGIYFVTDEPMNKHTSFKIGGAADVYASPKSEEELIKCTSLCRELEEPFTVLGNGSNVVFTDKGYRGAVISTLSLGGEPELVSAVDIRCPAGIRLSQLCSFALENSLSDVECLWGIPGTVGGAVFMNAGAYGGEVADTLLECTCITPDGELKTYSAADAELKYRSSRFMTSGEIITSAVFRLRPGNSAEIREKMDDLMHRRKDKQPLEYPSAGSVFKRPEGHYAAALIEECGLKGCSVGGCSVSEKHSGFIVNTGGATCFDLKRLIEKVKQEVFLTHGIRLECEVRFVGED